MDKSFTIIPCFEETVTNPSDSRRTRAFLIGVLLISKAFINVRSDKNVPGLYVSSKIFSLLFSSATSFKSNIVCHSLVSIYTPFQKNHFLLIDHFLMLFPSYQIVHSQNAQYIMAPLVLPIPILLSHK